jgi:alkylhydroperoxidase family enzyme
MTQPLVPMLGEEEALKRGRELGLDDYASKMHLFRVLLHHPKIAKELSNTIMALVSGERALTDREREIIVMRVAWRATCEYEWGQHWVVSMFFGMKQEELAAIRHWQTASCFREQERCLLAVTDAMLAMQGIPLELRQQLDHHYPDPKTQVEILACVGNWHMFAMMLNALELPLESTMPSWPPDGKAPR